MADELARKILDTLFKEPRARECYGHMRDSAVLDIIVFTLEHIGHHATVDADVTTEKPIFHLEHAPGREPLKKPWPRSQVVAEVIGFVRGFASSADGRFITAETLGTLVDGLLAPLREAHIQLQHEMTKPDSTKNYVKIAHEMLRQQMERLRVHP